MEAVHLFLRASYTVECVTDVARQLQEAAQPSIRMPSSDYL